MSTLLPIAWAAVLAFALCAYLVLDGFDLGVGILLLGTSDAIERDQMVHSIAPVWDGNETWLVLVGAGALGGFPMVYGILLPAFYLPLLPMLMALAFRGVSFEFRFQSARFRPFWDVTFCVGSLIAAFCQGVCIGALTQGVSVANGAFAGNTLDFLSPFSVTVGFLFIGGYVHLGALWLDLKTEGILQARARRLARFALAAVVFLVAILTWLQPFPNSLWSVGVLIAWAMGATWLWKYIGTGREKLSFAIAAAMLVALVLKNVTHWWPFIVPPSVTIWQAAAPPGSQLFLLIGAILLIPVILTYTAYSYRVFKGKVSQSPSSA